MITNIPDYVEIELPGIKLHFSVQDSHSMSWFGSINQIASIHEKPVTLLLLEKLKYAQCFVDVGMNLGWYTCLASKALPDGRVFGFEMDQYNHLLTITNLFLNRCSNVEVYHLAIGDRSGSAKYVRNIMNSDPCYRSRYRLCATASTSAGEIVSVAMRTLDDFFATKDVLPDVIKIDVEGAEAQVLKGASRILSENRIQLFVEVHPSDLVSLGSSVHEVVIFLIDKGYQIFEIMSFRKQVNKAALRRIQSGDVLSSNSMIYCRK